VKENLAKKLRVLRAAAGLTLDEVEQISGVTRETIGALEHGQRGAHTRTLEKLAEGYGVSLEYLVSSGPALADASSGKGEGSSGANRTVEADDVGVLLARLGAETMHLAEGDLPKMLEDARIEDILKVSREARLEASLLVPEIRRLLKDAKEGSSEYMKAMRVWGDAAARLHALRWLLRAKRGGKIEEIPIGVPNRVRDQGRAPRRDRLAYEATAEIEGLHELEVALG
jgi:transcriptional regulator with XRE-family HTH domain